MFTRGAAAALAGCAALLLSGCYVDVGALQHRTVSYSLPATATALAVHGHVGNVNVAAGGAGEVSVTARLSFRGKAPALTRRESGGTLTLDSSCPATETCGVDYRIRVPAAMAVNVSVSAGGIHLAGLTGQVTADASTGAIRLGPLSGPVAITDHAGTITGGPLSSPQATFSSNAGTIDVTFSAAPSVLTAAVTVGSVRVRLPGSLAYAVDAHSSVGSTSVTVPLAPASPHVITARVKTGSITIEPG
jgi:hypothetical protein